jgi:hypothetical protein
MFIRLFIPMSPEGAEARGAALQSLYTLHHYPYSIVGANLRNGW